MTERVTSHEAQFPDDVLFPVALFEHTKQDQLDDEQDEVLPVDVHGVSTPKTFLIIVKSFVASGVLFLPNAFRLGGIAFSVGSLTFIAFISTISMVFLVQCKTKIGANTQVTFGEIGELAFGWVAKVCVDVSLVASQLGFCAAYLVFVAQLLETLGAAIFHCSPGFKALPFSVFIAVQFAIYVPLVWIRNMSAFAIPSLIADTFIVIGLVVVSYFSVETIITNGIEPPVYMAGTFPLFIGTAVYTFEGIGLILPIENAMLEKHKFPGLLAGTMLLLLLVFIAFSSLTYLAYGAEIDTIVLLNLPQQNRLTQATVFLYALAMMATFPLQFFPAIRILDRLVFPRHKLINAQLLKINQVEGNPEPPPSYDTLESLPEPYQHGRISWTVTIQKNAFRGFIVACLVGIAIVGASQLESFISLIGAICCVPLAFIYPTLFHLRLVAETRWVKVVDIFIAGFGILAFIGCTAITIYVWVTQTPAGHHPCKNQTEYW